MLVGRGRCDARKGNQVQPTCRQQGATANGSSLLQTLQSGHQERKVYHRRGNHRTIQSLWRTLLDSRRQAHLHLVKLIFVTLTKNIGKHPKYRVSSNGYDSFVCDGGIYGAKPKPQATQIVQQVSMNESI